MSATLHHSTPGERTQAGHYGAALRRQQAMARAVEAEILPRLVQAVRGGAGTAPATCERTADDAQVAELCRLSVAPDPAGPRVFIAGLRAAGASLETLYLDLITRAARSLGEQWADDDLDFMQVTEGSGRLQRLMFELSPEFAAQAPCAGSRRRALLAPAPGEQHTFGVSMLAEFFRRDGWDVWAAPAAGSAELLALVRTEHFALVGFSTLCDASVDALSDLIRQVRRTSRNPEAFVMVGGPPFAARPHLAAAIGADATAADARLAVAQANALLTTLPGRD